MANMEDDDKLFIKLCRLRELFSGRYTTEEVADILAYNNGHLDLSVKFMLDTEPEKIRELLTSEANSWTIKTKRIRKDPSLLARARSGQIDTLARLYACVPCDNFWWRRTPARKEVSRCNRCRVRYDPVPRHMEWGWAEFHCPHPGCGRQFSGWCAMDMTSPCYGCGRSIHPTMILPPSKNKDRNQSRRRNIHSCGAPDCPGRDHYRGTLPFGPVDPTVTCVHPGSLTSRGKPKVVNGSTAHDSTGSTVDTFMSQSDINKCIEDFFPSLPVVVEEDAGSMSGNEGSTKGDDV